MNRLAFVSVAVIAILVIAGAAIVVTNNDENDKIGKDFAGMEINPVENLDNGIVAVGQDSFRWVTYFGLADKCVMVDMNDKTNYMGKAFMYVGKAQALTANSDLKFTSTNCGITPDDVRTIINLDPSIIIVPAEFESTYPQEMKALRNAGLNVFHIGYIYTFLEGDTFEMTSDLVKQIDTMSEVLNMKERGNELKNTIKNTVSDILSIREKITAVRTGYVGAIAYNGAHGIDSSISYYMPFALAGIENIMKDTNGNDVDKNSHVGTYSATAVKENMKDDTILFLDATGIFACNTNTDFGLMELFKDHEAYIACPYIWTGINYENVLVGAYQVLHDAYGLISDEELTQKINAVYEGFLGTSESLRNETASKVQPPEPDTSVYDDMSTVYKERRGNPIHGEISVSGSGITYL